MTLRIHTFWHYIKAITLLRRRKTWKDFLKSNPIKDLVYWPLLLTCSTILFLKCCALRTNIQVYAGFCIKYCILFSCNLVTCVGLYTLKEPFLSAAVKVSLQPSGVNNVQALIKGTDSVRTAWLPGIRAFRDSRSPELILDSHCYFSTWENLGWWACWRNAEAVFSSCYCVHALCF